MLSIGAMAAGQSEYYTTLSREDYYLEGGEPPGSWYGKGAEALGLRGEVTRQELECLFEGYAPDGTRPLVQLQKGKLHQPGWDLTFSAPKSVSVLWSQGDFELRQAIQAAHFRACSLAMNYLQANAAFTRRGHGGAEREACQLIAAAFEHGTSRAQDPQLHTHWLVMNLALRADGTFGTISSRDLYLNKMVAGVLYRVQLAHECLKLGLELRRGKNSFELAAVPDALCEFFSTRSHEIREALAREGLTGAAAAALAAKITREVKGHVARGELFERWTGSGRENGFSTVEALAAVGKATLKTQLESQPKIALHLGKAADELSNRQSHFSEAELLRRVAQALEDKGLSATEVIEAVRKYVNDGGTLEFVREKDNYARFAKRDVVAAEKAILKAAHHSRINASHVVSKETLEAVCQTRTLRPEQEVALRVLTRNAGSIVCLEGMAGTGKTYLLDAAREAWEKEGFRVIGCSLSARAARQLQADSRIESSTLASLLWRLGPPAGARVKHAAKRLLREAKLNTQMAIKGLNRRQQSKVRKAFGKHDRPLSELSLNEKTIVVLDEAGMTGSVGMSELIQHVTKAGAKLVCAGDSRQVQPIDAGAPFRALADSVNTARLTEIIRQRYDWMREAVHHFADGDARTALSLYAAEGKLFQSETRDAAMTRLIAAWNRGRTADLKETLILAGTRAETHALNLLAQELRRLGGELGKRSIAVGGTAFFEGDRVMFSKNSHSLRVANGEFGVVENIRGVLSSPFTPIVIRLDRLDERGEAIRVTLTPSQYHHIQLGYAVTTHKAQGATVDKTYVLAGGWMQDRELSYVQMSRHREDARIFGSKADFGEDLNELVASMERSRAKDTAIERPNRRREQEQVH